MYFNGKLDIKDGYRLLGAGSIYFRIWDTFDFKGDQPLGSWNRDVFVCEEPKIGYGITNEDFSPLIKKLGKINDQCNYNIITKFIKTDGLWLIDYYIEDLGGKNVKIKKE